MKAGNLEKELKEIRQGFAWMRTEQKEMKRWIRDALEPVKKVREKTSTHAKGLLQSLGCSTESDTTAT